MLLGLQIDKNLSFNECINSSLCEKADKKLLVLATPSNLMSIKTRRVLIIKFFIESQFSYCPLIWIFHGRGVNNEINHWHERSVRIPYKDSNSSFKDLIKKDIVYCLS